MIEFTKKELEHFIGKYVKITFRNNQQYDCYPQEIIEDRNALRVITKNGDPDLYNIGAIQRIDILPISEEKKNYESNDNMVSHPPHYQSATGLEVIDVIEAFTADLKGIEAADTANVIKYICRWNSKNGLQDLKKAMWYLTHLINHVEKSEKEND